MHSNKINLLWNSRKIVEVVSNHYSIRHKLLTVRSPRNRATKLAGHNMKLYPEILSRWSKQDLQWFRDTNDNFLLLDEQFSSASVVSLHSSCSEFSEQWQLKRTLVQIEGPPRLSVSFLLCAAGPECWIADHLWIILSVKSNTLPTKHVWYFNLMPLLYS